MLPEVGVTFVSSDVCMVSDDVDSDGSVDVCAAVVEKSTKEMEKDVASVDDTNDVESVDKLACTIATVDEVVAEAA
ncbi:hypothetical protein BgiMline_025684 [Biomphalaria glabrata]|nr:hypothetical protein BgiMline_021747 [Biomphalaria glabrata]